MNRHLPALTALALAVLIAAGCGGSGGSVEATDTGRDKAVKFSECMRDNGVGEFPDPDGSGELTIDAVANGSSLDTSSPAFEKAMRACKDLEPAGFTGRTRDASEQARTLRFAQCIRDNGVKDFPDPAPGDPPVDTRKIPSTDRPGGMEVLNAAMRACAEVGGAER
jgi:hypothetical protein